MARPVEKLLIVSHVCHYRHAGRLYAYGPYAREVDIWADLFPKVVIAAPCRDAAPPGDCLVFTRSNISVAPQRETGGTTLRAKAAQVLALPVLVWDLSRAMRRADAIHVRCPGNLGLLGVVLAPLFSRRLVAKYAGQWNGYPGEPWTVRLQRALLRSGWWRNGVVTVYGEWPGQPKHVVPFFTSVLTDEQVARARRAVEARNRTGSLRALYVGRLSRAKNVDGVLKAVAQLRREAIGVECSLHLEDCVRFHGAVDFDRVLGFYEAASVLVLPSQTEGWPKAVVEAMAFGVVCIGSDRGLLSRMLGEGRGIAVPPGDAEALAGALRRVVQDPEGCRGLRTRAAEWAQRHTLEGLREALRELLSARWGEPLQSGSVQIRAGAAETRQ
jgi:glycosyltransferase involved in cell wall biosynthesis